MDDVDILQEEQDELFELHASSPLPCTSSPSCLSVFCGLSELCFASRPLLQTFVSSQPQRLTINFTHTHWLQHGINYYQAYVDRYLSQERDRLLVISRSAVSDSVVYEALSSPVASPSATSAPNNDKKAAKRASSRDASLKRKSAVPPSPPLASATKCVSAPPSESRGYHDSGDAFIDAVTASRLPAIKAAKQTNNAATTLSPPNNSNNTSSSSVAQPLPDTEFFDVILLVENHDSPLVERVYTLRLHAFDVALHVRNNNMGNTHTYSVNGVKYKEYFHDGDNPALNVDATRNKPSVTLFVQRLFNVHVLAPLELEQNKQGWNTFWNDFIDDQQAIVPYRELIISMY